MADDDKQREGLAQRRPDDSRAKEKELADACARFADLCQYYSQQNMALPSQVVEDVRLVSRLAVEERIARMKRLNQELTEYLNDAGPEPQVRQ